MKNFDIPIVLVQLGPASNQLKANLKYLNSVFPNRRKFLITDIEKARWLNKSGFTVIHVEELAISWPNNFEIDDRRRYFRDNFWFVTKARLLLIAKFMSLTNTQKILHFENDVWINPRFPFDYFDHLEAPLAFPRVDDLRGIASVLFVNGIEGITILENGCEKWPKLTDMEILGRILAENSSVHVLDSYDFDLDERGRWLFDGAKIGMYLFGADPRNSWGLVHRFKNSPMGKLQNDDEISLKNGILVIRRKNEQREIANLHIHSKHRKVFSVSWEESMTLQIGKEKDGLSKGFNFVAFIFVFKEFVGRAFRKVLNFVKKPLNLDNKSIEKRSINGFGSKKAP